MKKLLSLILALSLMCLAGCGSAEEETAVPSTEATEAIAETQEATEAASEETQAPTQTGETEPPRSILLIEEYMIEQWYQDNTPLAKTTYRFRYNDDYSGGTAEVEASYYSAPVTMEFTCDENGNITALWGNAEGTDLRYDRTFDENGNLIRWQQSVDGTVNSYKNYTYNEQGLLTRYEHRYTDYLDIEEYIYDGNGNLTEEIFTYQDHTGYTLYVNRMVYTLDENGLAKSAEFYYDGELKRDYIYTYDDQGRRIGEEYYEGGTIPFFAEFVYDDENYNYTEYYYDQDGYEDKLEVWSRNLDGKLVRHQIHLDDNTIMTLDELCLWTRVTVQ